VGSSRYATVADLRVGLLVEYLGIERETWAVLSEELTSHGVALFPGHPGQISSTVVQHVQVCWVGLEDEPESFAVGFGTSLAAGLRYPGLGHLAEADFLRREQVLKGMLASGRDLSNWVPPWTTQEPA
jgi:hypothetical protein